MTHPTESTSHDLEHWLRLTLVPDIGTERQRHLLAAFGLPERIFAAGRLALEQVVGPGPTQQLLSTDSRAQIEAALAWADEPDNRIITLADPAYPPSLLHTPDPPCLIYVKGRLELLNRPSIAMVGARSATPQGVSNAEQFATAFSRAGLTVVSGLALGIDAAAHRGALLGDASTVAVIGTGIDRIYPARNATLARAIAESGAIVSEFPLGMPPLSHNFPRRNRIISGLSRGVLVVEAAVGSGSLITARQAAEQGREVFAIPGSIHSPLSRGCHQLIKQGAKLVESAADVLDEMGWQGQIAAPVPLPNAISPPPVSQDAEKVLLAMGFDPVDAENLLGRARLTPDALFAILTALELDGRIARLPGNRYQRLN
ncbi:DNA-processing protein DprA [Uliginosibacterium sp. sgz301328]|uniref:DNA-processing protein DprA n=1 Tax=Uliginosibacterium sp. sgz301328 TaxID=3243764 RepID=UPI00359CFD00